MFSCTTLWELLQTNSIFLLLLRRVLPYPWLQSRAMHKVPCSLPLPSDSRVTNGLAEPGFSDLAWCLGFTLGAIPSPLGWEDQWGLLVKGVAESIPVVLLKKLDKIERNEVWATIKRLTHQIRTSPCFVCSWKDWVRETLGYINVISKTLSVNPSCAKLFLEKKKKRTSPLEIFL